MLSLVAGTFVTSQAQVKLPAGTEDILKNFITPPKIGDVGKTSTAIVDMLSSKLGGLASTQKKSALDAVTGFLNSKSKFLDLAKTSPADYLKKFNPLQSGLFSKLKTILGAAKFANFLNLKPTKNIATNVLSNLFF